MILLRKEIYDSIKKGEIIIEPYNSNLVQPNNYDFHLDKELYIIECFEDHESKFNKITIPDNGFTLMPNKLYLGATLEKIKSPSYSQFLFGDRSIGSLGIWVHITAPLGHTGSSIKWTLEIRVTQKTKIYPYMRFGKIFFMKNQGVISQYGKDFQNSKYLENKIMVSKLSREQK